MSDTTDDLDYWEDDDDFFNGYYDKNILTNYLKGKLKWRTINGAEMLIEDMEDLHILNTKKYLDKMEDGNSAVEEWKDIFDMEIKKRKL